MITFDGTAADVQKLLSEIVTALGGGPDAQGVARAIQLRAGVTALSKIQQAFIVKSRGGTGDDGIKWDPLSRKTIAARRITPGERKAAGGRGKTVRGLLTPEQDKKWRAIYAGNLARLRLSIGEGPAKARAAQIAWAILKSQGAKTKLEVFGSRVVDIGRDSGRMFRSLTPGIEEQPSGVDEQVFQTPPGKVIVGTNVPYAGKFHAKRPLWPEQLPQAWREAVLAAIKIGIVKVIENLLARGMR